MGMHLHVFVGPYLKAKATPTPKAITVRGCPKVGCRNYPTAHRPSVTSAADYCPTCGTKIENVSITVNSYPSYYDIVGDELTALSDSRETLLLAPNVARGKTRGFFHDDAHYENLLDLDRHAEVAWFESAFADEIKKIRETCIDVELCWGVHLYYI